MKKKRLGLVARYYADGQDSCSANPNTRNFFENTIKSAEKYGLQNKGGLADSELFHNGKNYQLQVFYNDGDGVSSFENFKSQYRSSGWQIEDKGAFVRVHKAGAGNREINIYANKPFVSDAEESKEEKPVIEAIKAEVGRIQGVKSPKFDMIYHRGHSYHADSSMEFIGKDTKLVFMGSCGGYNEIGTVLKHAPDAQIISTNGTGSKTVNDPLSIYINKQILSGSGVSWEDVWDNGMGKVGSQYKVDYRRPDSNAAEVIERAYKKIKSWFGSNDESKHNIAPEHSQEIAEIASQFASSGLLIPQKTEALNPAVMMSQNIQVRDIS